MWVETVLCMTIFTQRSGDGERRHRAVGEGVDSEELESPEDELQFDWMEGNGKIDGSGLSGIVLSTLFDSIARVRDL